MHIKLCAAALVASTLGSGSTLAQDYRAEPAYDTRYYGDYGHPDDRGERLAELGLRGRLVSLPTLQWALCRRLAHQDGMSRLQAIEACPRSAFTDR